MVLFNNNLHSYFLDKSDKKSNYFWFLFSDLRYMTKLLERRIQVLNADINEKRKVQLNVAKEMDELRPKIQAEKEKERHYRKVIKALKAAEVKSISSISSISSDDNNNIVQ